MKISFSSKHKLISSKSTVIYTLYCVFLAYLFADNHLCHGPGYLKNGYVDYLGEHNTFSSHDGLYKNKLT